MHVRGPRTRTARSGARSATRAAVALAVLSAGLLLSCSEADPRPAPAVPVGESPAPVRSPTALPSPPEDSLRGARLTVGSEDFDEQVVLGAIAVQVLRHAGATVVDRTGSFDRTSARKALQDKRIDLYWQYTGVAWDLFLDNLLYVHPSAKQFAETAAADLRKNRIAWLSPYAPGNDTYAIVVRSEATASLGVRTLDDLQRLSTTNPEAVTLCVDDEFAKGVDTLSVLFKTYGLALSSANLHVIDSSAVYTAVDRGRVCNFGAVYTTDSRVRSLGLTMLRDDQDAFPSYNPAVTVRSETLSRYPALPQVFAPISPLLDTQTLTDLNYKVTVQGQPPEQVARRWLDAHGLLG